MRSPRQLLLAFTIIILGMLGTYLIASAQQPMNNNAPKLQYVGGIVIYSSNAKELAAWYSEKFGMKMPLEQGGGYFGGLETSAGPFRFGIMPPPPGFPGKGPGSVAFNFRVDDYDAYIAMLKTNGVTAMFDMQTEEGRFAMFTDPGGNMVGIWGE
jgi:predicted enzyme related to lactoylglutathione lyase